MPSIEYRPDRPKPYRARYWGPDGRLHSRSFVRKDDAERWLTSEEASKLGGAWVDPRGSRRRFDDWATQWWELWASEPRRSPAALEAAESHLRLHIRPYFGRRPLGTISAQVVQRWQNELERRASHNLTMAEPVAAAMARRLEDCGRDGLVFSGPGGSNGPSSSESGAVPG
jgi:Phage integrase, N-terminal SAM-like domain